MRLVFAELCLGAGGRIGRPVSFSPWSSYPAFPFCGLAHGFAISRHVLGFASGGAGLGRLWLGNPDPVTTLSG